MIKEALLVLALKKITNMTRNPALVSETVKVTTVVASIQSASITNAFLVRKMNTSTLLPRNVRLIHAKSTVSVAEMSVLMIKEALRVLALKKITNMTRNPALVSETVKVTTVVASIQSASITNAFLVRQLNTSTLLPRNVRLIHAKLTMFVAEMSVLMIKEALLVLALKKITNMTRNPALVS